MIKTLANLTLILAICGGARVGFEGVRMGLDETKTIESREYYLEKIRKSLAVAGLGVGGYVFSSWRRTIYETRHD